MPRCELERPLAERPRAAESRVAESMVSMRGVKLSGIYTVFEEWSGEVYMGVVVERKNDA